MANTIALAMQYVPLLDEVYKLASVTSILDGAPELVRQGANADEMIIPKMSMEGLADYSRNSGYVDGDVTLTNETVKCNFDRGRSFTVDAMDNIETAGIAFGRLAGEFIRTKVAPEIDAFRFASYAGTENISKAQSLFFTLADNKIQHHVSTCLADCTAAALKGTVDNHAVSKLQFHGDIITAAGIVAAHLYVCIRQIMLMTGMHIVVD